MSKTIPISQVELKGEKIKEVFFLNVAGGEKTFLIFESGKVLIMPVYQECPVQYGVIENLKEDFDSFLSIINQEKSKLLKMESRIKGIKKWPGQ